MPYWDERVEVMAKDYPDVRWDKYHIDILTALFVARSVPSRIEVVPVYVLLPASVSVPAPSLPSVPDPWVMVPLTTKLPAPLNWSS